MNEPGTGGDKSPDKRPADPRQSAARPHLWRNTVIILFGAPVLLAGLTAGGFGLFSRIDDRDPKPREFQSDGAGSGSAYYRVRADYLPRQGRDPGAAGRSWLRRLGATLFDEGLTTTLTLDIAQGEGPVQRLAQWRGDNRAGAKGILAAYRKQNQVTVAVTVARMAQPRLRWKFGQPQWVTDILGALMPKAGADQPPLIRIPPPAAGQQPAVTTIVVRNYKGIAIGDLHVTSQWRSSVLFDPAIVQVRPAPNPAIDLFVATNASAAARRFAIVQMIRSTGADFTAIAAIKSWTVQRFAIVQGGRAKCAATYDAAIGQFGLSAADAALLTYFLHRNGPDFTTTASLATACGRKSLGAALLRIGASPTGTGEPPTASPAPPVATLAPPAAIIEPPVPALELAPVAAPEAPKSMPLPPGRILHRLAREWRAGLAARADSTRFIRVDATLIRPNLFKLFSTTPLADRAAILDDHAANRVHHFACFTKVGGNSMAVILERRQGAATAVFRYRFFFDAQNKIHKIHRRPAIQADINDLKYTLRGTACTDRFLAREEARLRQIIGGQRSAEFPPLVAPTGRITIESTLIWKSPPPRGRSRNRVTVDLSVLESIPKSTLPHGGG